MSLTDDQIVLIRTTFRKLVPIAETVAMRFYTRLFDLRPDLRLFFKSDMQEQNRKLMHMLAAVVGSVDRLDDIMPSIHELGDRHVQRGIAKEDYRIFGETLVWAFEQSLGEDFPVEASRDWLAVYRILAEVSIEAYPTTI